jgi:hypothetical protein
MKALTVVVKNPVPGAVKTRLHSRYSPDQAANLYTAFVQDTLDIFDTIPLDRRSIAFDPPDAENALRKICGNDWEYVPQVQEDLGQRMYQALIGHLQWGAKQAILMGTDIPSLPATFITDAFELLRHNDVVLGPSTDGGYYLVGLSRPCPEIFQDMPWSTPPVFHETIEALRQNDYSLGLIPPWFDVDTPEDLDFLLAYDNAQELATGRSALSHTRACLSALT